MLRTGSYPVRLAMYQTKLDSLIEACINTSIGFIIATGANIVIFPIVGITATVGQSVLVGVLMTGISIARSYCIRRWANKWLTPARLWLVGKFNKVKE